MNFVDKGGTTKVYIPVHPCRAKEQILTEYHLRQGSYKVKCNSDSSSHKTRSVLLLCGQAHTDSLWPILTRVKSGQAQFDTGQNGPGSQVGLEHIHHCSPDYIYII